MGRAAGSEGNDAGEGNRSNHGARGGSRRSQRRGAETRRRVQDAALRLIARNGLGAVRFREVAAEAEVSLGVVTYHFPSRRALIAGALERHLEDTDADGRAFADDYFAPRTGVGASGALDLEPISDAAFALLSRLVHEERESFIAGHEITLELTRDPDLAAGVHEAQAAHRDAVRRLLEQAGSSESELDAEILSAAFQGLALKWIVRPEDPEFARHLRQVVRRLMAKFIPA